MKIIITPAGRFAKNSQNRLIGFKIRNEFFPLIVMKIVIAGIF